jgi:integrase
MAIKRFTTKTPGVRFKLHSTRKHGVGFDKYFSIRYRVDGKLKEESLGWASEGWSEKKAAAVLAELKANHTLANGPRTLEEKRDIENARREEVERQRQEEERRQIRENRIIFDNVFEQYCESNEHKKSLRDEANYYKNWIAPAIGKKRLDQILLFDLEKIRAKMTKAGKAPRSIGYTKSIVRQVYHFAMKHKLYAGDVPTTHFLERQRIDNKRQRYLSPAEAGELLADIKAHSLTTWRVSLVSLNTGMRFSEIAGLRWQHINIQNMEMLVLDPKNGETRAVYLTDTVLSMFDEMQPGRPDDLVFVDANGRKMARVSNTFIDSVNRLGLNDGIDDRRLKVVFHSLRHSCASTLVNAGVEIPVVAKILGHKTLTMTMRYSHINDDSIKSAMAVLDRQQGGKITRMRRQSNGQ